MSAIIGMCVYNIYIYRLYIYILLYIKYSVYMYVCTYRFRSIDIVAVHHPFLLRCGGNCGSFASDPLPPREGAAWWPAG